MPWTRPGNRKELLAAIPIAYVLTLKRVIYFSDLPRGEQFLGRPCTDTWEPKATGPDTFAAR